MPVYAHAWHCRSVQSWAAVCVMVVPQKRLPTQAMCDSNAVHLRPLRQQKLQSAPVSC